MTAKEEAKALAENWLAKKQFFEVLIPYRGNKAGQWIGVSQENFDNVIARCVGIRLLFEA